MAQQHVGIGKESTYGTAVAPTDFLEGAETVDLQVQKEVEELSTIRAHSIRVVNVLSERVQGTISSIGNYQELGLALKLFYGSNDVSGVGPYTHTFPASTGVPDAGRVGLSGTVEVKEDASLGTRYAGCKITQFRISGDQGRSPRVELTLTGKSGAVDTPASFTDPGFDPMLTGDTSITVDNGGGAEAMDLQSFDLTLARPVDEPHKMGSTLFAAEPRDGKLTARITATMFFLDNNRFTDFLNSTVEDVVVAITDGTHSITVNINKALIVSHTKPVNADNARVFSTVEMIGYFDATATEAAQVVLVNDDTVIP